MIWMQKKILLAPIVLLAGVFALDKVFLVPAVRDFFQPWQKIEPPLYASRFDLYNLYRDSYAKDKAAGRKIGVVFGSSRSAEFDTDAISKQLAGSKTYNFSAPFACPAFHYYWLHRMVQDEVLPDYALIETDLILFNERAVEFSLGYAYDAAFVLRNTDWQGPRTRARGFSTDEAETFFLKRLFATYRYPPDFAAPAKNAETIFVPAPDGSITPRQAGEFRDSLLAHMHKINEIKLGGIPNLLSSQLPPDQMRKDAKNMASIHLQGYRLSRTQTAFFRRMLVDLSEGGRQIILYKPVLTPEFNEEYQAFTQAHNANARSILSAEKELSDIIQEERARLDPEGKKIRYVHPQQLQCKIFVDSVHLSGRCFPELEKILFSGL
jgi:hypothetical protein